MRIVGGEFRGRSLNTPRTASIRPTSDRTRESLFNIVEHAWPEALDKTRVLDLFAGTGALGLEALSRGARSALFVENGVEGRAIIQNNIEAFGLQGRARIFRRDATRLAMAGTMGPFDLMFADPPYGKGLGDLALAAAASGGWLAPNALAILEERADAEPAPGAAFSLVDVRNFGISRIWFFRHGPPDGSDENALEDPDQ